jgi:diketogulonate reductase-like aldo/keto reductase
VEVWNDAKRPHALRAAVEHAIADLQSDYVDLLLLHWPNAWKPGTREADPEATLSATWDTMASLVADGLVRQLGVANFGLKTIEKDFLDGAVAHKPVCNMVELHPWLAQRKLVGTLLRKVCKLVLSCVYPSCPKQSFCLHQDSEIAAFVAFCW